MDEDWRLVKGVGDNYIINRNGVVKSIAKTHLLARKRFNVPEKIIKTDVCKRSGYPIVKLAIGRKRTTKFLHRLLAEAFINNPENKPCVNHIDGDKTNYALSNLEWVTHSENMKHAYKIGLCKIGAYKMKKVIDSCTGKKYHSIKEAAIDLAISYSTCKNMLNGNRKNTTCLQLAA